MIISIVFFIDLCLINKNTMANEHYEKYKETIKRVARRNYQKRISWVNQYLANKSCHHCGESETICVKFYPHNNQIRRMTKRVGMNDESRKDVVHLINHSRILCSNCWIKLDNDVIELI